MSAQSPDGAWWWDGNGWVPAISPDGARWFDGQHWVDLSPRWHRPSRRAGTVLISVAGGLLMIVGVLNYGDPEPNPRTGRVDASWKPGWFFPLDMAMLALSAVLLLAPAIHSLVRPPQRRLALPSGIADYARRRWRRSADTAGWILMGIALFLGPFTAYAATGGRSEPDRVGAAIRPDFPRDILPIPVLVLGVVFLLAGRVRGFARLKEKAER